MDPHHKDSFGAVLRVPFLSVLNTIRRLESEMLLTDVDSAWAVFRKTDPISGSLNRSTFMSTVAYMIRRLKLEYLTPFQALYVIYMIVQVSKKMIAPVVKKAHVLSESKYEDNMKFIHYRLGHVLFNHTFFRRHNEVPSIMRCAYQLIGAKVRKEGVDLMDLIECLTKPSVRKLRAQRSLDVYRKELMETAWHPSRTLTWCLDTSEIREVLGC